MSQPPLRIGILETGRPPEDLAAEFGDYPGMVRDWLGAGAAAYSSYAVLDGKLPGTPLAADLWVVTGSKFGAYEDHPWIPPLEDFIRAAQASGVLMFGICFGHQIIAQALGGVVRKSAKGWGLGIHEYPPTADWPQDLGPAPEQLAIVAYHQDQVEEVPAGAVTIAATAFCDNAALWYPGFALTVQGHPEIDKPYASALMEARRGIALTDAEVEGGERNLQIPDNRAAVGELLRAWLDQSRSAAATG